MMFMFGMRIGQYVSAPVTYWTGPWLHFSHICLFYFHCTMAFLCCFDQAIFFCHASYYSCRPLIQSMEMFRVFFFFWMSFLHQLAPISQVNDSSWSSFWEFSLPSTNSLSRLQSWPNAKRWQNMMGAKIVWSIQGSTNLGRVSRMWLVLIRGWYWMWEF